MANKKPSLILTQKVKPSLILTEKKYANPHGNPKNLAAKGSKKYG